MNRLKITFFGLIVILVLAISVQAQTAPPVLNPIGSKSVDEGQNLNFNISATDEDGTVAALSTSTLPPNAAFNDNGDGTGTFNFDPDYTQAGVINITFYASDTVTTDVDSEIVAITVNNVNLAPVVSPINDTTINENQSLIITVNATDADGTTPSLTAENTPVNATFIDNGNGTGTFTFNPDYTQSGLYNVSFIASDGLLAD
ncbi:MAG: Ig-like domain-containing protein, partial [candidate division Zixibacteria bacterium]|nr:Ig-like domain-containing protein [candidate division Zixibacteria bacterium]